MDDNHVKETLRQIYDLSDDLDQPHVRGMLAEALASGNADLQDGAIVNISNGRNFKAASALLAPYVESLSKEASDLAIGAVCANLRNELDYLGLFIRNLAIDNSAIKKRFATMLLIALADSFPQDVATLLAEDSAPEVRAQALWALRALVDTKEVWEAFARHINDAEFDIRQSLAVFFWKIGRTLQDAVANLSPLLTDTNYHLRFFAARALHYLAVEPVAVAQTLQDCMRDAPNEDFARMCAEMLTEIERRRG